MHKLKLRANSELEVKNLSFVRNLTLILILKPKTYYVLQLLALGGHAKLTR